MATNTEIHTITPSHIEKGLAFTWSSLIKMKKPEECNLNHLKTQILSHFSHSQWTKNLIPIRHGPKGLWSSQRHLLLNNRIKQPITNQTTLKTIKVKINLTSKLRSKISTKISHDNLKTTRNLKATSNQMLWVYKTTRMKMMPKRTRKRETEKRTNLMISTSWITSWRIYRHRKTKSRQPLIPRINLLTRREQLRLLQ